MIAPTMAVSGAWVVPSAAWHAANAEKARRATGRESFLKYVRSTADSLVFVKAIPAAYLRARSRTQPKFLISPLNKDSFCG
jgi:hypothetical protein